MKAGDLTERVTVERFTATYDAHAPGLAAFLRDAMAIWAEQNLTD